MGLGTAPKCKRCGAILKDIGHYYCYDCYGIVDAQKKGGLLHQQIRRKKRIKDLATARRQRKAECVKLGLVMGVIPGVNDDNDAADVVQIPTASLPETAITPES